MRLVIYLDAANFKEIKKTSFKLMNEVL